MVKRLPLITNGAPDYVELEGSWLDACISDMAQRRRAAVKNAGESTPGPSGYLPTP